MNNDLRIDLTVVNGELVVTLVEGATLLSEARLSIDYIISQRKPNPNGENDV